MVVSQPNRYTVGSRSVAAYAISTVSASSVCTTEPATGAPVRRLVRPSAAGRTRSRPSANRYRATVWWKASSAANRLVRNSRWPASTRVGPTRDRTRLNISSVWSARAAGTIPSGPVATDIAQADSPYSSPTTVTTT